MNQKLLLPIVFSIILLSLPVNTAYAHHCNAFDILGCIENLAEDVDKVAKDVAAIPGDITRIEKTIVKDVNAEIHLVENEVNAVEERVVAIEKTIDQDVITVIKEIEKDVDSVEKVIVNDLVNDVKDVKADVAKIEKLVVSVERIEKKIVETTEEVIKAIIGDVKSDFVYIIYGILAIAAAYVTIRIIQFAIWLKAYLRQDGIEHSAKRQVEQNDEIISLLKKMTK